MAFEQGAIPSRLLRAVQTPLWGQAPGPPVLRWSRGVLALSFPRSSGLCGPSLWQVWPRGLECPLSCTCLWGWGSSQVQQADGSVLGEATQKGQGSWLQEK